MGALRAAPTVEGQVFLDYVQEHRPEALEALAAGRDYEWKPDTISDSGDMWALYDDDSERYYQVWYEQGVSVLDGCVYDARWQVDLDGNWDAEYLDPYSHSYPVETAGYAYEAQRQSWKGYYEQVAETGDDYLGIFMGQRDPGALMTRAIDVLKKLEKPVC